jgi:hypothetical protein
MGTEVSGVQLHSESGAKTADRAEGVLVAPGEGAIMAAPEGARAPVVEGSERVRAGRISLAIESQSVPDEGRDTQPEGPTDRARKAGENEKHGAAEGCSAINS